MGAKKDMNLTNKTILLTGATGSFGSAFIKHLISTCNNPKMLIAYSRDWLKQKRLRDEIGNPKWIKWTIGDIRDKDNLYRLHGCNYVIHAAAIKDLTTCEDNALECCATNVIGTMNIIDYCKDNTWLQNAVFISTDKAVNPINTYGVSKKLAEKLWIWAGYNVARYGNVIGSAGSVLPVYQKLISQSCTSLPVTDERCTRFWFPMDDAIKLVITALDSVKRSEVFIPKMKSIRIIDLCKALDMPYHVTGIRPGEKLHEDMIPYDPITDTPGYNSLDNEYLSIDEIRRSIQ